MVDLEVVGRHALLFDDDAMAEFVNAGQALVEWNSLSVDRYDVRHLLPTPLPPLRRRVHGGSPPSVDPLEADINQERFLDLPLASDERESNKSEEKVEAGGYHAVTFSYGNHGGTNVMRNTESGSESSVFYPSFPVPENLLQSIPPTDKVHQIIARTALFVRKHGGQSEIILRVKQGDNPTFGFLMPDHHLHSYFRLLVDNPELLKSDAYDKDQEEKRGDTWLNQVGGNGALSLLGTVYGSGEDEDVLADDTLQSNGKRLVEAVDAPNAAISESSRQIALLTNEAKDAELSKPSRDKAFASKKISSAGTAEVGTSLSLKKESKTSRTAEEEHYSVLTCLPKDGMPILEPPSDLKRHVDKVVEFILKNGREFEAVLAQQDYKLDRFPFLLPSNRYHPYYLKVLQEAKEAKITGKRSTSEKIDSVGEGANRKAAISKQSDDSSALEFGGEDIPYSFDRKEKFKMVIGKPKKDADSAAEIAQPQIGVSVDADAAAAILQAARRGIKNPNLGFLSMTSSVGRSSEGGSSQPQDGNPNLKAGMPVPVANALAKTAAIAAAGEADSSEAGMTKEQKLKAERLKRAKMFAEMIKYGATPLKPDPTRGLSVKGPASRVFGADLFGGGAGRGRERSSIPCEEEISERKEKPAMTPSGEEINGRRPKRMYRSRPVTCEDDDTDDEENEKEERENVEREEKRSRKKHRSHHSKERRHRHRKKHSSSKERESRLRHKYRHRHEESSDEEQYRKSKSHRRRREREADLEEGEIGTKLSDQSKGSPSNLPSREAFLGLSNSYNDGRGLSQPSETTEVSDDLRAKIRAMLMATM